VTEFGLKAATVPPSASVAATRNWPDLPGRRGIGELAAGERRLRVVHQGEGSPGVTREVDDHVGALGGGEEKDVGPILAVRSIELQWLVEKAPVRSDLEDRRRRPRPTVCAGIDHAAVGEGRRVDELHPIKPRVRSVEYAEAVRARLDVQVRPRLIPLTAMTSPKNSGFQ